MNTPNEQLTAPALNPTYWRRYGFQRDPFGEDTHKEFFIPSSWEESLDLLPQFARFCDTLLLIIGTPKIGKTTLINLFINEQSTDTDIFTLRASDCTNANDFLQLISQRYGAPYDAANPMPASEKLHQQLDFLRANKQSRLLIIDDAEKLPLDMRQLCLQIIQQQNALTTCLPIILVGENNLSEHMHALLTPTTAQKCLYTIPVEPFSEDETEQYLRWCCTQAGEDKAIDFPLTPEDIATIFQASKGVVGEINSIAQRLLNARTKPGMTLPPYLQGKIVWWGGAIIVIALLLVVYQQLTKPSTLDAMIAPSISSSTPTAATPEPATPTPAPAPTPAAAVPAPTKNTTPTSAALEANNDGASAEDLPHSDASTAAPAAPAVTPAPITAPVTSTAPAAVSAAAATPAAIAAIATPAETATLVAKKSSTLFNDSMSAELQVHQNRVLHTPPSDYTLQLIASPNLHIVQKFISVHQLSDTALIVPTKRNNQFYYIVLYGNFPNKAMAEKAAKHLEKTKKIQPWVRTYKSVQELIKPVKKAVHKKIVANTEHVTDSSENW